MCDYGPGYDTFAGKFQPGANSALYPYDEQGRLGRQLTHQVPSASVINSDPLATLAQSKDDKYSALNGATGGTATNMFTPEQIPIKVHVTPGA